MDWYTCLSFRCHSAITWTVHISPDSPSISCSVLVQSHLFFNIPWSHCPWICIGTQLVHPGVRFSLLPSSPLQPVPKSDVLFPVTPRSAARPLLSTSSFCLGSSPSPPAWRVSQAPSWPHPQLLPRGSFLQRPPGQSDLKP